MNTSVLTPYYKEDVLYSEDELNKENEDGISILFYLQKIYPGTQHGLLFVFQVFGLSKVMSFHSKIKNFD